MACKGMASPFFPPNFMLQMQTPYDHMEDQPNHIPSSLTPLPQDYHAMFGKRSLSMCELVEQPCEEMNGEDELSDDCSQLGEKKRRLSMEQVRTLEKNFEIANKLEPERKMQLARALGLQPKQIAIWFQNRRARWKTKQLEKDYDVLKKQFEAVKSENDSLLAHNKKLQAEIMALSGREISSEPINLNKETEVSCSYRSDNSSDINLEIISRTPANDISLSSHHNRQFFPMKPPTIAAQLMHSPKLENGGTQEENFCNMFCTLDDQPAFWTAWQEQQSFH